MLVQCLQREYNLAHVEPCPKRKVRRWASLHFLIEVSNALKVEEELAAWAVLEYEVELLWVLECVLHFYDKRVGNAFLQRRVSGRGEGVAYENKALRACVGHLISLDEMFFSEHLDSVNLLVVVLLNEHDFAVGALPDHL